MAVGSGAIALDSADYGHITLYSWSLMQPAAEEGNQEIIDRITPETSLRVYRRCTS